MNSLVGRKEVFQKLVRQICEGASYIRKIEFINENFHFRLE